MSHLGNLLFFVHVNKIQGFKILRTGEILKCTKPNQTIIRAKVRGTMEGAVDAFLK